MARITNLWGWGVSADVLRELSRCLEPLRVRVRHLGTHEMPPTLGVAWADADALLVGGGVDQYLAFGAIEHLREQTLSVPVFYLAAPTAVRGRHVPDHVCSAIDEAAFLSASPGLPVLADTIQPYLQHRLSESVLAELSGSFDRQRSTVSWVARRAFRPLSCESVAANFMLSSSTLRRWFRYEPIGLKQMLCACRILHVAQLLDGTPDPITVIARRLRFSSSAALSTATTRLIGVGPRSMRARGATRSVIEWLRHHRVNPSAR